MSPLGTATFRQTALRRSPRSTAILQLYPYLLAAIPFLYFVLSTPALLLLGWNYLGGGSEIEKIHPATYLLFAGLCASLVIDKQFRSRIVTRIACDPSLVSFTVAVVLTTAYSIFIQGASAAPFVDTFFGAIMATIVLTSISIRPLTLLRTLIDTFFAVNILAIFLEVILQRNLFFEHLAGVSSYQDFTLNSGAQDGTFGRPSAFFGHSLDAALLFGVYSIANLASTPVTFSTTTIVRISLSLLSYMAIFPTGGRSSMVATTIVLLLYVICSSISPIARGYVNKAGLTFIFLIGILLVPIVITLFGVGFFEPMMERFEYDYGSALSRDYALQLLQQSSAWDLWFGRSVAELNEIQQSFGLIAIEISWINFILVAGLITTIPLFITFCLFLFRSTRLYCTFGIYFVSLLVLISTSANNGIWSKTTVLAISLIVGISFLRRDRNLGASFNKNDLEFIAGR